LLVISILGNRFERSDIIVIPYYGDLWSSYSKKDRMSLKISQEQFDAIRQVESGGRLDAVGDKGRSIGPYQIQEGYWKDAVEHNPSLKDGGKTWQNTKGPGSVKYSERVMLISMPLRVDLAEIQLSKMLQGTTMVDPMDTRDPAQMPTGRRSRQNYKSEGTIPCSNWDQL